MADYKVVFRADDTSTGDAALLWEPSCPAMLTAVQVSRNVQTSEAYLQVKVRNVSGVKLESVYGVATVNYADGSSDSVELEDLDVDLAPGGQKALKAKALPKGDVESAVVKLNQIALQDDKWSSSGKPAAVPNRIPVALREKAMTERRRKLEEAGVDPRTYDFAVQDKGDWWICSCGQVNVDVDGCCECGASKTVLMSVEDESSLLGSADEWSESIYQKAVGLAADKNNASSQAEAIELFSQVKDWKDSADQVSSCEAQLEKLKTASARRLKKIVIAVVAVVAIAVAAYFIVTNIVIPTNDYNAAVEMAQNGKYDEAVAVFEELGDFKDSKEQIVNTKVAKALALIEAGNQDEALKVLKELEAAGGSTEEIKDAYLNSAEQMANEGQYAAAYMLVTASSSYTDTDDLLKSYAKSAGDTAMKDGDYASAVDWYQKAGESSLQQDAKYEFIKANFNNGNEITFGYIKELRDAGYKDTAALYDELYAWHVEMELYMDASGAGADSKTVWLRYKLSGGEPGARFSFNISESDSYTFARTGETRTPSSNDDFSTTVESSNKYAQDGWAKHKIKAASTNVYTSYTVSATVTAQTGETVSGTFSLK